MVVVPLAVVVVPAVLVVVVPFVVVELEVVVVVVVPLAVEVVVALFVVVVAISSIGLEQPPTQNPKIQIPNTKQITSNKIQKIDSFIFAS